jgi:ketosteroid isomerase-like protein
MSESAGSNAGVIRGLYGEGPTAWDEAVVDHWYEHRWDPEIEWRAIPGAPDDVGLMPGRDRLRQYYAEWLELFEDITIELTEVRDVGELVVASFKVSARSRSAGMVTELSYSAAMELRGGRIVAGREYATVEEAVAAAEQGI